MLAPYERDFVLEKCDISSKHTGAQHVDARIKLARSETQVQTDEIPAQNLESFGHGAPHGVLPKGPSKIELERCRRILQCAVQNLENFEDGALLALVQKPSKIKVERRLRILKCVNEIGSPHILDSLKLACARNVEGQTHRAIEQPLVEELFQKLFRIHCYLDKLDSQSQLLVARERYIKYCYFETYLRTLVALQDKKHNNTRKRRKVWNRKQTTSFKQGISEELPSSPDAGESHRPCNNANPSGRNRRARDLIRDEICSKLERVHGSSPRCIQSIRSNVNKYIRQGKVLHLILQGGRSLGPGLLVLFPSVVADPPSLNMAGFGGELLEVEEKALSHPIRLKE